MEGISAMLHWLINDFIYEVVQFQSNMEGISAMLHSQINDFIYEVVQFQEIISWTKQEQQEITSTA